MILKKISLENIRSYESFELEFPTGSVLLSGDIGSGKTTVLLAIEFALFGLQPGQRGTSMLRSGKDYGKVNLNFEIDGNDITIERGIIKKGKSINQSGIFITINGERSETSVSELKNKVLRILNYPMEFAKKTNLLYKFTVYTPQEEMKQIILEDAQTRLNAIRHVFGINKYKIIRENINILTASLREEIRNKEGVIRDLDNKKQTLEERKTMLGVLNKNLKEAESEFLGFVEKRKEIENKLASIREKIEEKKKFEQEIEKTLIAVSGKKELIQNIEREIKQLNEEILEIRRLSFSEDEMLKIKSEKEELIKREDIEKNNHLDMLTKIKSLNSKNIETNSLKEQIQKLQLCPTCLQNVDNDYKQNVMKKFDMDIMKNHEILKELNRKEQEFNLLIENISKRKSEIDKRLSELQLIKVKLESVNEKTNKITDNDNKKENINKDVDMLLKQIELLKNSVRELVKYDNIFIKTEEEFREALKHERDADLNKGSIKKEIELTINLIHEMESEISKKEDVKKDLIKTIGINEWVSKQFLDLVTFTERNVLLKLREEFSKIFNDWFNILVPDIFTVSLDEDFTPVIYHQDFELAYNFLSGGERTAIALAYRLALNKTINSLLSGIKTRNLIILDEPTDGFSEQQLDKMRDVLMELDVEQLIIVSHEQKIESFVENIIKLKKENGLSGVGG